MQIWIGTSGFSYSDWVGAFYPPGTSSRGMLACYVQHFPLVELNFTFYRAPTPAMLARLGDQTPDGFQFIVKLPRSLSHEEDPSDLLGFGRAVEELKRRGRLLGLLCQLPQATHRGPHPEAWLRQLAAELGDYRLAVEFRHRSWYHPEVPVWLREHNLDLVAVDVPDLDRLYPRGLVYSGPDLYIRFHSRHAANWYLSDKERYDYDFTDEALREWVEALGSAPKETRSARLLFNNCHHAQAPINAQRMRALLAERSAGSLFQLVEPFDSPTVIPTQGLLFE
jgi:uncharacterized protein YecE (DUF72 family)